MESGYVTDIWDSICSMNKRRIDMGCVDCPIRRTDYCHKVNPMAKKYTRSEKNAIREELDKKNQDFSSPIY